MYEDEISRVAFADADMVRHLLALLPEDAVAGLGARRLRRLPAEHVGRGDRRRVADMAWAVGAPTPIFPFCAFNKQESVFLLFKIAENPSLLRNPFSR